MWSGARVTDTARGDPGWGIEEEPFGVGARPAVGRDQGSPAGQGRAGGGRALDCQTGRQEAGTRASEG